MSSKVIRTSIVFCFFAVNALQACSTFCLNRENRLIFGRNFDWMVGEGLVMVNKRCVEKTALVDENPAHWTSKYGSLTFNLYGREFPMDGINEAGLVIACLWLKETEYPDPDERPCLNDLQWIQYQLDNFRTVDEVINSDLSLRITPGSAPLHFLVCDKTGACATIEFLEKKLVYNYMSGSYKALTNDIYISSMNYFNTYKNLFDNENNLMFYEDSVEDLSLAAFSILMNGLNACSFENSGSAIDFAFSLLKKIKYGDFSKWSLVYDLDNMKVHYFTSQSEEIKSIDLNELDFSATTPVLIMDINENARGEVNERFIEYTREANQALIEIAYRATPFLKDTPSEVLDLVSEYPESPNGANQ